MSKIKSDRKKGLGYMARDFDEIDITPTQAGQLVGMDNETIERIVSELGLLPVSEDGNSRTYPVRVLIEAAVARPDKMKSADRRNEAQADLLETQNKKIKESWGNIEDAIREIIPFFQAVQTEIQRSELSEEAKSELTELLRKIAGEELGENA
jgi:glycerophosphoryl diester phosphodiesterase